jgi:UDP-glucose:tetrahydrobiopterin glucosyltransferase
VRIVIASTPVGPLGSGLGGGVELTLHNLVHGLTARGHEVQVVAPAGSLPVGARIHQIEGALQVSSQAEGRDAPISMPAGSVLVAMWERIADLQDDVDIVVNLAYDWLPFFATRHFRVPIVHLVSMGSVNDVIDQAVADLARWRPGLLAVHSRAQAATFPDPDVFHVVGNGIVTERYDVVLDPPDPPHLGFVGRISPEKGLEDVAEVAARTGLTVRIWGIMQDPDYWERVLAAHPTANLDYQGFLATDELQSAIGGCRALLMTPKWVEAFGNVAVEAMATGVPVIAYDRGGPAEIVVDGVTGFIVPPDDTAAAASAVGRLGEIDRRACRRLVEEHYSTGAWAERMEAWFNGVI